VGISEGLLTTLNGAADSPVSGGGGGMNNHSQSKQASLIFYTTLPQICRNHHLAALSATQYFYITTFHH